jgi:hypothetical protein
MKENGGAAGDTRGLKEESFLKSSRCWKEKTRPANVVRKTRRNQHVVRGSNWRGGA